MVGQVNATSAAPPGPIGGGDLCLSRSSTAAVVRLSRVASSRMFRSSEYGRVSLPGGVRLLQDVAYCCHMDGESRLGFINFYLLWFGSIHPAQVTRVLCFFHAMRRNALYNSV